jgi:hypothetical protein
MLLALQYLHMQIAMGKATEGNTVPVQPMGSVPERSDNTDALVKGIKDHFPERRGQ